MLRYTLVTVSSISASGLFLQSIGYLFGRIQINSKTNECNEGGDADP